MTANQRSDNSAAPRPRSTVTDAVSPIDDGLPVLLRLPQVQRLDAQHRSSVEGGARIESTPSMQVASETESKPSIPPTSTVSIAASDPIASSPSIAGSSPIASSPSIGAKSHRSHDGSTAKPSTSVLAKSAEAGYRSYDGAPVLASLDHASKTVPSAVAVGHEANAKTPSTAAMMASASAAMASSPSSTIPPIGAQPASHSSVAGSSAATATTTMAANRRSRSWPEWFGSRMVMALLMVGIAVIALLVSRDQGSNNDYPTIAGDGSDFQVPPRSTSEAVSKRGNAQVAGVEKRTSDNRIVEGSTANQPGSSSSDHPFTHAQGFDHSGDALDAEHAAQLSATIASTPVPQSSAPKTGSLGSSALTRNSSSTAGGWQANGTGSSTGRGSTSGADRGGVGERGGMKKPSMESPSLEQMDADEASGLESDLGPGSSEPIRSVPPGLAQQPSANATAGLGMPSVSSGSAPSGAGLGMPQYPSTSTPESVDWRQLTELASAALGSQGLLDPEGTPYPSTESQPVTRQASLPPWQVADRNGDWANQVDTNGQVVVMPPAPRNTQGQPLTLDASGKPVYRADPSGGMLDESADYENELNQLDGGFDGAGGNTDGGSTEGNYPTDPNTGYPMTNTPYSR
jgi:hypothetical protein